MFLFLFSDVGDFVSQCCRLWVLFVCLFVCFGLDSACMLQLFEFCQHNRQQLVDGDEVMLNVLRYQLTY